MMWEVVMVCTVMFPKCSITYLCKLLIINECSNVPFIWKFSGSVLACVREEQSAFRGESAEINALYLGKKEHYIFI